MPRQTQGLTPAQVNYQPLQLERFAAPLAQKQQKYDQTVSAFEDANFGVSGLPGDTERTKALSETLAKDRDEVLSELERTKNYRQAAKKLKKLNKVYNQDPEISGIRGQKAAFDTEDERQKERLKKGDISETQYKKWKNYTLSKYQQQGGYGFDRTQGIGKGLAIPELYDNIEDDMFDAFLDVAKGQPANVTKKLMPLANKFGINEGQLKTTLEIKDKEDKSRELYRLFSQNKNFQDYIENQSMYDWFDEYTRNENLPEEVLGGEMQKLQAKIQQVKQSDLSDEEKKQAIANITNQGMQFASKVNQAKKSGQLDKLAESVYKSNYMQERLGGLSDASADAYDYYKIDESAKGYKNSDGSGPGSKKKVIENNAIINKQIIPTLSNMSSAITPGMGTQDEEAQFQFIGEASELNQQIFDSYETGVYSSLPKEARTNNILNRETAEIAKKTFDTYDMYDKEIEEIDTEIAEMQERLESGNLQAGEASKLTQDISQLQEEKYSKEVAGLKRFNSLEQTFIDASENGEMPTELSNLFSKGGLKEVSNRVKDIASEKAEKTNKAVTGIEENANTEKNRSVKDLGTPEEWINSKEYLDSDSKQKLKSNPEYIQAIKEFESIQDLKMKESRSGAESVESYQATQSTILEFDEAWEKLQKLEKNTLLEQEKQDPAVKGYYDLIKKWHTEVSTKQRPTTGEIIVDDNFKAYVGEDNYAPYEHILTELKSGDLGRFSMVNFDTSTGEIKGNVNNLKNININRELYNLENPRYQGTATHEGNDQLIFRVSRNKLPEKEVFKLAADLSPNSDDYTTVKRRWEKYKNGEITLKDTAIDDRVAMIADWTANNPENAQIMVQGVSSSLTEGAQETLISTVKTGMELGDKRLVKNTLESYSTLDAMNDTRTRRSYNEASATLKNAMKNKDPEQIVTQTPHTYVQNEDGTRSGYVVEFGYEGGTNNDIDQMQAKVWKHTIDGRGNVVDGGIEQIDAINLGSSVHPTTLKQISLYYGAGAEWERIIDETGRSFVPAFQTNQKYNNLNQ